MSSIRPPALSPVSFTPVSSFPVQTPLSLPHHSCPHSPPHPIQPVLKDVPHPSRLFPSFLVSSHWSPLDPVLSHQLVLPASSQDTCLQPVHVISWPSSTLPSSVTHVHVPSLRPLRHPSALRNCLTCHSPCDPHHTTSRLPILKRA